MNWKDFISQMRRYSGPADATIHTLCDRVEELERQLTLVLDETMDDAFTCQECGLSSQTKLRARHVLNRPVEEVGEPVK